MTRARKEILNKRIETYIYLYFKKGNYADFYLDKFLLDYIAFELNCSKTMAEKIFKNLLKQNFQTWLHNFEY